MKLLLLALFVAVATANPIPDDDGGPVDVIVNGVPEGEALDIADIIDIHVKEHVDGQIVATSNVLYPFTSEAIAAAAAAAAEEAQPVIPDAVGPDALPDVAPEPVIPGPVSPDALPEVVPEPVIPGPIGPGAIPEVVPEPIILGPVGPDTIPEVVPEPIIPGPIGPDAITEVVPEPVIPGPVGPDALPEVAPEPSPALAPVGEIYNDGLVQIHVNHEEPTLLSSLQQWFSMVINYVSGSDAEVQSTQIV